MVKKHAALSLNTEIIEEFHQIRMGCSLMRNKELSNPQMMELLIDCANKNLNEEIVRNFKPIQVTRGRPKRPHVAYGDKKYLKPENLDPAPPNDRDRTQPPSTISNRTQPNSTISNRPDDAG